MKNITIIVIIIVIITAAILWLLNHQRKRKLPPLTLRIVIWVRSMIRHTLQCVKRALRLMYNKRLARELVSMASKREPIKLSEEVTVAPEEEENKELLVLMN